MIKASKNKKIYARAAEGSYQFIDINQYNAHLGLTRNNNVSKNIALKQINSVLGTESLLPQQNREITKLHNILKGKAGCKKCKKNR